MVVRRYANKKQTNKPTQNKTKPKFEQTSKRASKQKHFSV